MQGNHILQPIGKFDQQYPDIRCHGQEQLTDILCLMGQLGVVTDIGNFGGAIHDIGHIMTKLIFQLLNRCHLLLEHTMK